MKKLILALTFFLAPSLFAQTTQTAVTGTITDPNSIAYYPATVQACLTPVTTDPVVNGVHVNNNQGVNYCGPQVSTSPVGSFSMALWPNAGITPGSTQWTFTVTATGSSPPAGKGPQTFQVPVTISGSSQSVSATLSAVAPVLLNSGSASGSGFASKNGVDATASKYGLKADTKYIPDATFTNGANTISCSNNDCNFSASVDNGKICFGTNMTSDTSILTSNVVLAQGTLTVTGAQTATCSGGNWTGSTTSTNVFVWGSDDSAALTSAWADAVTSCVGVYLPSGSMLVQSAQFITPSTNDICVIDRAAGYGGYGVNGTGFANTRIIPTPNFSSASCTGSAATDTCFFGVPGQTVMDLTIWGAGNANIGAGFNGKVGAKSNGTGTTAGTNAYWYNVGLISWGATTAGFTGLSVIGQSNSLLMGVHNDGFGAIGCNFNAATATGITINLYNVFCAVDTGPSVIMSGPGGVYSYGGVYGWTTSNSRPSVDLTGGGSWWSYGDSLPFLTATNQSTVGSSTGTGGTVYFDGTNITNPTNNSGVFGLGMNGGMTLYARNSIFNTFANNGATPIFVCATCKFFSQGGNLIQGGGASSLITVNSGGIYNSVGGTDKFTNVTLTAIRPTLVSTGTGTGQTDTVDTPWSFNEQGSITVTAGTTPGSSGTFTLTMPGFAGINGQVPICSIVLKNGTGTWNARASVIEGTTSVTSNNVTYAWAWDNNAVALTAASTYRAVYSCRPR